MINKYSEIIDLEPPTSKKHPRMTINNRAAIFAPFAALKGYNEAIIEKARLTNKKIIIDEGLKEIISTKLQIINDNIKDKPIIEIKYFIKDLKKSGGKYNTISKSIRRIDVVNNIIILTDNTKINIDDIIELKSDLFKNID